MLLESRESVEILILEDMHSEIVGEILDYESDWHWSCFMLCWRHALLWKRLILRLYCIALTAISKG